MSTEKRKQSVIVIGGGIAGLVTACQLARRGFSVTLFEQHRKLGGRWQEVHLGNYRFDLAPPMIRMATLFKQVFREAKKQIDPTLQLQTLEVSSRNFFAKGSMLDLSVDATHLSEQFAQFSSEDYEGFIKYIETVHKMYHNIKKYIKLKPFLDGEHSFFSPTFLWMLSQVHPFQMMNAFHQRFFNDPRLVALLNRYASVMGSSPFETPAFVTTLAYLDVVEGVSIVKGGSYRLIESLARLAEELDVVIKTECKIDEIMIRDQKAVGVRVKRKHIKADLVVSTVDIRTTKEKLLHQQAENTEHIPSNSEFVCLLGVKRKFPHLHHHNFFFPSDYGREFIDMMNQNEWSLSPCLYVGYSGFTEATDSGGGSNLCIRINVPPFNKDQTDEERAQQYRHYRDNIVYWLENHWAFQGITEAIEVEQLYGPKEWEEMTGAWHGSLYGDVYHGRKAFFRPSLRDPERQGLYYAGATTFPSGGGVFSAISGMEVSKCIAQDVGKT